MTGPDRTSTRGTSPAPAAAVTVATMALATIPTPLWPAYAAEFRIDTAGTTVLFAVFAVGAIGGLLGVRTGPGRRVPARWRIVAAALAGAVAAALLATGPGVPGFAAARLLSGLGVGVAAAGAVTFITVTARRTGRRVRLWTALTPGLAMAGLALGAASAGLLVGGGAVPRPALYGTVAGVLAVSAALLLRRPPVAPDAGHPGPSAASAPVGVEAPPWVHRVGACTAFAVTGLFGALTSHLLAGAHQVPSAVQVGLLAAVPFLAAACGAVGLARRAGSALPLVLAGLVVVASATTFTAGAVRELVVFTAGATIAGVGAGALFSRSLTSALRAVPPAARPTAASEVFTWAYVGLAVPVVAVGSVLDTVAVPVALGGFIAVVAAAGLALGIGGRRPVASAAG